MQVLIFALFCLANLLTPPLTPPKNEDSSVIEQAQNKETKVDELKPDAAAEEEDEEPEDNDEFEDFEDEDDDYDFYDNNFEDDKANKGL